MLRVDGLCVSYGDAVALTDVTLAVGDGELLAVIGPNGAGKTTLVNALARLLPIRGGSIRLMGEDVGRLSPRDLAERGVALIPEGRRLFAGMSVEENLEMGCYRKSVRRSREEGLRRVYEIFPILAQRRRQIAGTLSGGQQQMVAIARALRPLRGSTPAASRFS
jgi:branched-chain amino acid transport system ATP-binding protein